MWQWILSLSALVPQFAAQAANHTEIINGYKFIESGPKVTLPKVQYEMNSASTALALLKRRLGPDALVDLLRPDIQAADAVWHAVLTNSTPGSWVSADARVVCFLPSLTAARFALWSQSPLADAANAAAEPEHYVKQTAARPDGTLQSRILEGWGGVTTLFSVEGYGAPNRTADPFLQPLPEFPYQAAGDKVLLDGTGARFGVLHVAMRDVEGALYGEDDGAAGVEVLSSVWYGDGAADSFLEAERQHMVVEIVNLAQQAKRDIDSGAFVPPV